MDTNGAHTVEGGVMEAREASLSCSAGRSSRAGPVSRSQEMFVEQPISWWLLSHLGDWRQSDEQTVNHVSKCP